MELLGLTGLCAVCLLPVLVLSLIHIYTTRKDNAWAKANPDEVQQCYIMTGFHTAAGGALSIPLMQGISPELMEVNTRDDIKRWWEVMDRTAGEPLAPDAWRYDAESGCVVIDARCV